MCNIDYKNVAALTSTLKKAQDRITPDEVRDICTVLPHQIKVVVKNGGGYIE